MPLWYSHNRENESDESKIFADSKLKQLLNHVGKSVKSISRHHANDIVIGVS